MASFEKLEGNQVKLTMSIPAADFEKAIDSAYLKPVSYTHLRAHET